MISRACLILALFTAVAACAGAVTYSVWDLGSVTSIEAGGYGINNSGQVTGATTVGGQLRAFLWDNTNGLQLLGTLGGTTSFGRGINSAGQIVGQSRNSSNLSQAFIWDSVNGMLPLTAPGFTLTNAQSINDSGQIAGLYDSGGSGVRPFEWQSGTAVSLPSFGGTWGQAFGINNSGQVTGTGVYSDGSWSTALWQNDPSHTAVDMLALPGSWYSQAFAINNSGQIAGGSYFPSSGGLYKATLWSNGSIIDLNALAGDYSSLAYGVNNSGQVVGFSASSGPGYEHAFFWDGTLNALPTLGGTQSWARDINDSGWIVGAAQDAAGGWHAALWTPVPEPSSLMALAGGVFGLGGLLYRRRKR